ncbi:MAG: molybdopterin-dependent oxidoreductase [Helicobacteraceae bacterium]|nr:molybdopterin-dependent oxidoreductase [Helicobacteraceae bacterium]
MNVCAYCGVGCEIKAQVLGNTILSIEGDPNGVVSGGKLCVKGRFGFDFVASPSRVSGARIKKAFIDRNRDLMPIGLQNKLFLLTPIDVDFFASPIDVAIEIAAWKTRRILEQKGGKSFGFIGGARTSCESAYFFQKFAREIIGSPNIDNCARVCHSPSLAGLKRTLGEGAASVPFEDIFRAEAIVVIGSNTTEAHPIVGLKILEAARKGAFLATIDVRRVAIGRNADLEAIVPPESNLAVLNAIAREIITNDLCDLEFIAKRTVGFESYKAALLSEKPIGFGKIALYEKLTEQIPKLSRIIASKRTLFIWGLGVTEHIDGSDAVSAIANLALLSGNIGKIGAGVMPLRGQNNVQGACDMGVLPYYGAGYSQPKEIGLTSPQMFEAILSGEITALFNMGEDIARTSANLNKVISALDRLDFFCVCELFMSGAAQRADIVIGVKSAYEKRGIFINAERRVRLSKPLVESAELDDWEFFAALTAALGFDCDLDSGEAIWREVQSKAPDMFGAIGYEEASQGAQWKGERLYEERFCAKDRLARFYFAPYRRRGALCASADSSIFYLITGRVASQYNNAAQTSETPRLNARAERDILLLSPIDAKGLDPTKRIKLISRYGESAPLVFKADESIAKGTIFCSFHQARSRINYLFGSEGDSVTQTPRFKAIETKIEQV